MGVVLVTLRRSMKAQLREANRVGSRVAVILGEAELAKGAALVKNMATGEQAEVEMGELVEHITAILHTEAEGA